MKKELFSSKVTQFTYSLVLYALLFNSFYLFYFFLQRMWWLSYSIWVLWESCQPWKQFFSILRIIIHTGLSSLTKTGSVWSCQTPVPPPQFWKSYVDGCQGFTLVVHNVRQPVLCRGDGVSMEHMVHCLHARCNGATPVLHGVASWVPEWNYPPAGKRTKYYYLQTVKHKNSHTHC